MKKGETLFEEDDVSSDGFILLNGRIELWQEDYSPNSKLVVYDTVEAGEVFGVLKCIYGTDNRLYSAGQKQIVHFFYSKRATNQKIGGNRSFFILYQKWSVVRKIN